MTLVVACFVPDSEGPGELDVLTFEPASNTAIAVGAQFAVVTNQPTHLVSAENSLADTPAHPRWTASPNAAVFEAKAEGEVSVIAEAPDGGTTALDLINVELRAPDQLSVSFGGTLFQKNNTLTATLSSKSQALDGDFGCTWTVSDASVASVTSVAQDGILPASFFWVVAENSVELSVHSAGTVTVTASCLGFTQSIGTTTTLDGGADGGNLDATADASDADDGASDASDDND